MKTMLELTAELAALKTEYLETEKKLEKWKARDPWNLRNNAPVTGWLVWAELALAVTALVLYSHVPAGVPHVICLAAGVLLPVVAFFQAIHYLSSRICRRMLLVFAIVDAVLVTGLAVLTVVLPGQPELFGEDSPPEYRIYVLIYMALLTVPLLMQMIGSLVKLRNMRRDAAEVADGIANCTKQLAVQRQRYNQTAAEANELLRESRALYLAEMHKPAPDPAVMHAAGLGGCPEAALWSAYDLSRKLLAARSELFAAEIRPKMEEIRSCLDVAQRLSHNRLVRLLTLWTESYLRLEEYKTETATWEQLARLEDQRKEAALLAPVVQPCDRRYAAEAVALLDEAILAARQSLRFYESERAERAASRADDEPDRWVPIEEVYEDPDDEFVEWAEDLGLDGSDLLLIYQTVTKRKRIWMLIFLLGIAAVVVAAVINSMEALEIVGGSFVVLELFGIPFFAECILFSRIMKYGSFRAGPGFLGSIVVFVMVIEFLAIYPLVLWLLVKRHLWGTGFNKLRRKGLIGNH